MARNAIEHKQLNTFP